MFSFIYKNRFFLSVLLVSWISCCFLPLRTGVYGGNPFKVFVDNKSVPVEIIEKDGNLYINLKDMAKYFPDQILVDSSQRRVDLFNDNKKEGVPDAQPVEIKSGIMGQVVFNIKEDVEIPQKNIPVNIYVRNSGVPDEIAQSLLKDYLTEKNNDYIQKFGLVRSCKSDPSGNFYFENIPPGSYQMVAFYYVEKGKTGVFWRKNIEVKKGELLKIKLESKHGNRMD